MNAGSTTFDAVARAAARHSLGWLVAANLVGVWLAVALLWPAAGDLLAPLTYGRWMPLHLNWQLYGWTALPVVGVLLVWFVDARLSGATRHARLALAAWSLALVVGGVSWLSGHVSGKLFLDWSGFARPLLPAAMLLLWGLLVHHTASRWPALALGERWARGTLLALLLPVPALLHWASGRAVFPAVNPDSGGATGASLLGSTLGIVTIFLLLPALLRVPRLVPAQSRQICVLRKLPDWAALGRLRLISNKPVWAALVLSWGIFAAVGHGHESHHALTQIAALAVLLAWVPLLAWHWLTHAWPAVARPWLLAALGWWALLVATGWLAFLPGWSEQLKFTHGFVAHAHLAMAGVVTSVNAVMLTVLARRPAPRGVFAAWQLGCAVHVAALLALGATESAHAAELFRSEAWTQALLGVRLAAGLLMTGGSVRWLADQFLP